MQRFTISIDDAMAAAFDELIARRGYVNRSEAFRDLIRKEIGAKNLDDPDGRCVAVVSYLFDHHKLDLSNRMTDKQHEHTGLVISSLHVHVNADDCVEAVVMRGPTAKVRALAEATIAERGIENGAVNLIAL